jgi:hypothetical protein
MLLCEGTFVRSGPAPYGRATTSWVATVLTDSGEPGRSALALISQNGWQEGAPSTAFANGPSALGIARDFTGIIQITYANRPAVRIQMSVEKDAGVRRVALTNGTRSCTTEIRQGETGTEATQACSPSA